jgi:hypothetical protein
MNTVLGENERLAARINRNATAMKVEGVPTGGFLLSKALEVLFSTFRIEEPSDPRLPRPHTKHK